MNKAYEYRIYPTAKQQVLMNKTFGCARFIYNKILNDKKNFYEETGKSIYPTPASYKEEYPWLKEVDSLALSNSQLHINTAFKNFYSNPDKFGFPNFHKKMKRASYTTNLVNGNIVIYDSYIKLPKVGNVKLKKHRDAPKDYKLKSVTVKRTSSGKWFVSVLYKYERDIIDTEPEIVLGMDFSMKDLFVTSEGYEANYPKYYRETEVRLKRAQRQLSLCQKGSKNREKKRYRVSVIHEKVRNQRKDFLHKLSNQIANDYDLICIEDLNMQNMSKALHFGKSVHDNGWGMFVSFLSYKLADRGKHIAKIDKFFPSTKTCSCCGEKRDIGLSERTYTCLSCGMEMDRDVNAAINIRKEGLATFHKNRRADGDSSFMLTSIDVSSEKLPLQGLA